MYSEAIEKDVMLSCLHDEKFIAEVYQTLSPSHFNSIPYKWIYWANKEFFRKYHRPIDEVAIVNELRKSKKLTPKKQVLYKKISIDLLNQKPKSKGYTKDQITEYIGDISFIQSLDEASTMIEKGNVGKARDILLNKILSKQTIKNYTISSWLEEFNDRQKERLYRKNNPNSNFKVRPPYKCLSSVFDGIQGSEVCSITGITNAGKSIMLGDWGANAVLDSINVAHITIENTAWQTNQRYDSRILDVPYDIIKHYSYNQKQLRQIERNIKALEKAIGEKLIVLKSPIRATDVIMIEQMLRELEATKGFYTQFLIIDSPDIMKSVEKFESFRLGQGGIYWDVKALAMDRNLPILVSTHAPKEYGIPNKKGQVPIPTAEATGESYWKARILDIIFTLYQTTKQKFGGQISIHVAKNRDGPRGAEFVLYEDFMNIRFLES